MKRFIFTALFVIAIAASVLPAATGVLAEREIERQLDEAREDPNFTLELESYQRRWFRSTAALQLRPTEHYLAKMEESLITAGEQEGLDEQRELLAALAQGIDFDADIVHGPLGWQSMPFFGLASVHTVADSQAPMLASLQSKLELPYVLQVQTLLHFDGTADFAGDMPEFSYRSDGLVFEFPGLEFDGRADADAGAVVMHLVLPPGILGRNGDVEFSFAALTLMFDGTLLDNRIWMGDSKLSLEQLSINSSQQTGEQVQLLQLEGLEVRSDTRQSGSGDSISLALSYTLERLNGVTLPEIEALRMDMLVEQLDRAALDRYVDATQMLGAAPGAQPGDAMEQLGAAVYGMLAGSPTLTLEPVSCRVDGEPAEARVTLQVDGENLPPPASLFAGDSAAWRSVLSGAGRLALSEPLAQRTAEGLMLSQLRANTPADSKVTDAQLQTMARQQSQAMLAGLLHQGMLVREGQMVHSEFDYERGALSINGQAMPMLR